MDLSVGVFAGKIIKNNEATVAGLDGSFGNIVDWTPFWTKPSC